MDNPETPKKIYRRKSGRKPQIVKSADEFCRVCKCALKTKYGSLESFVNVFKPCQREGFQRLVVADLCRRAGINRDFKIRYGEVLLRLRKVKFTSGDVSTCVAVRLSSRSMLFYYGKVLRLA